MRPLAPLLVLLLASTASGGEAREPVGLKGAPGVFTPPAGTWKERAESLAAGQWFAEYEAAAALMRVHVFPVKHGTDPEPVLTQAIDTFFRGLDVHGFGVPSRRAIDVWGCPGASASIMAQVGGRRVSGRAKIVLLGGHQWGFAIGYASSEATRAQREAVNAFVAGLEPREPVFYERRFHTPKAYERIALRVPGDEPLTAGAFAAVERVIEAGIGARFPLAIMPPIREALVADAKKGTARTRAGYRATAEALEAAAGFDEAKRNANMRALGRRILEAILERANLGYAPALQFARAWHEFRGLRIGTEEDGLTAGDLANRIEMSEFLASVAADRELKAQGALRQGLVERVNERWKDIPKEERAGWRTIGALWSALRYAWDHAQPAGRLAFRRAVAAALHDGAATPGAAVRTERELKAWLAGLNRAGDREEAGAELLRNAFDLSLAERRALIDTLGVEDAYGFHFGW